MGLPMPTIAIIGHGRSPEGRGWGERINAADHVVRMWNWHWQDPADYGTRYDTGVIEVHKTTIRDWRAHNQHQPESGWIASMLMRYRDMVTELPRGAQIIDQEKYLRLPPRQMRGFGETGVWQLTRGGIAACWAISSAREGDTVVLVGFDVIKAGIALPVVDAFSPEYMQSGGFFGMGAYVAGKSKEGNHDYAAERELYQFMAARSGVSVAYAEDIWP
jgi:hypothetical protein